MRIVPWLLIAVTAAMLAFWSRLEYQDHQDKQQEEFGSNVIAPPAQSSKFAKLDAFFKMYPGHEFYISDFDYPPDYDQDWRYVPFVFEGQHLWARKIKGVA
jgi:hypothetical protein